MKKAWKKAVGIFAVLLAFTCTCIPVRAAGVVTYEGTAKKFIFTPGSQESPSDLFENFKSVMPGDSLTQSIEIRNGGSELSVQAYLKAVGTKEASKSFLSQLTMTVRQADGTELYHAPADQTTGLGDWVDLGTIEPGGKVVLEVTLEVPAELDDEFQNASGTIDWKFKVEELLVEGSEDDENVKDDSKDKAAETADQNSGDSQGDSDSGGSGESSLPLTDLTLAQTEDTAEPMIWCILILGCAAAGILLYRRQNSH